MAWDQERVRRLLQSRYRGRNIKEIWYGTESHIVILTFLDGTETTIRKIDDDIPEEKAANLIERMIR